MTGRTSQAGVPLDDLPAGLMAHLDRLPVDIFLRNRGNLVLYAPAGADARLLSRADLAGRLWVLPGDVPELRAALPDALRNILAASADDPLAAYRDAYRLIADTLEPVFGWGCEPDRSDVTLVERTLDVIVDHHLADDSAGSAVFSALRRRHEWVYDALNTSLLSIVLARAIQLEPGQLRIVARGGFFHDLGMTHLPASLLEKPGPLDPRQFARVRGHPDVGVGLLTEALGVEPAYAGIVREHHERLDGSGYPGALRGAEIDVTSQVVAIADTWEAMTSRRPHRAPADFAAAEERLLQPDAGFDLRLTGVFVAVVAPR
jgi:HD-GYP domain-containing protein (c-di-GMP phosphodiesterase class II)